jgi:hypothetical protein
MYIPINNQQGGGANIFRFQGKKPGNKNTGSALDTGQKWRDQ